MLSNLGQREHVARYWWVSPRGADFLACFLANHKEAAPRLHGSCLNDKHLFTKNSLSTIRSSSTVRCSSSTFRVFFQKKILRDGTPIDPFTATVSKTRLTAVSAPIFSELHVTKRTGLSENKRFVALRLFLHSHALTTVDRPSQFRTAELEKAQQTLIMLPHRCRIACCTAVRIIATRSSQGRL